MISDCTKVLNEASALLFRSSRWGERGHSDARGKKQGGGKAPTQFLCYVTHGAVQMLGLQSNTITLQINNNKRGEDMRVAGRDISAGERRGG